MRGFFVDKTMTKNIEQRTVAAVKQYENASKTAHDLTNTDSIIDTAGGQVKSLPKVAKEWDAEREILSIKSKPVLPWAAGETQTDLNQQRRFTDGHTYLPKTVPALMNAEPDDNWFAYMASKSDVLSDVFGNAPVDLVNGLVITPVGNQYPKLSAFGAIYELADNSVSYTVKSFAQSVGGDCVITLDNDECVIASRFVAAPKNPADIKFKGDKFSLARTSDNKFFVLINNETRSVIARFADNSNESDAHLFELPFEVRRDSHSIISTAKTRNGITDFVARTNGYSDFFYSFFRSEYGQENFALSFDAKPARADGTRKDGTGGSGQLSPEDDIYQFDDALVIPSNMSGNRYDYTQHLRFPALYATFEQGIGVKRRTRGNYGYQWNFGNSDNNTYIECLENTNKLIEFTPDSIVVAGCNNPVNTVDYALTPIVKNHSVGTGLNSRTQVSIYKPSISSSSPLIVKVVKSGIPKIIRLKINLFTDTSNAGYWIGELHFDGAEVRVIGTPLEKTLNNVSIEHIVDDAGDYAISIKHTSNGLRVSIAFDIN